MKVQVWKATVDPKTKERVPAVVINPITDRLGVTADLLPYTNRRSGLSDP